MSQTQEVKLPPSNPAARRFRRYTATDSRAHTFCFLFGGPPTSLALAALRSRRGIGQVQSATFITTAALLAVSRPSKIPSPRDHSPHSLLHHA